MQIFYPEKINPQGLVFKTNSQFQEITFSEVDFWTFSFANEISVTVESFWRLLSNNRIVRVSYDHLQQFGLPEPIDLVEKIGEILSGKDLTEIKVVETTGDLILSCSDNLVIEIFITSSGYESYSFCIDNKRYIGMGSGEISMYDTQIGNNPL